MGGDRQQGKDLLQGAASVAAVLGALSAVCFGVGSALIALRLKALGFSMSILVSSSIPRDYGFAIGLRTVWSNAPFGASAFGAIYALAYVFARRHRMARMFATASRVRPGMAVAHAGAAVARSRRVRRVMARVRAWPLCRLAVLAVLPVALVFFGHMWILPVSAVAVEWVVWMAVRRARSPACRGRRAPLWPHVTLAVAITAAVAVASEADRISAVPFAQAVVVFRHGPHQSDVLGLQKPPVHPVYDGTDPLCVDEQKPHVCGLLLSEGGDGVTVASLEFPRSPRIVAVPHDEVASTFVVPAETDIGADQATYRRSPLYCRLPLLKELTRRRCGRAVRPIGLPTIAGIPTKGQTLTESHGSWSNSPTRFSYQWQDCDRYGTDCSTIAHATRQTYVLAAGDVSSTLRVQETASNAGGSSSPSRSRPSALVRSLPRPPHRRRT